jgi:hypothetical protein
VAFVPRADNVAVTAVEESPPREPLRQPAPGPLWRYVKVASWIELAIFTALCVFWLAPGFDAETFVFGSAHGVGYLALIALIVAACFRHQCPYVVLAASLTPVGPLGTVIAIEWTERRRPAYRRS